MYKDHSAVADAVLFYKKHVEGKYQQIVDEEQSKVFLTPRRPSGRGNCTLADPPLITLCSPGFANSDGGR